MSGLFDDEGKTPARGRKNKASESAVVELADEVLNIEQENKRRVAEAMPGPSSDDMAENARGYAEVHPFEASVKAAQAIADDIHPDPGVEQINRLPISLERRAKILDLIWERTRFRTGRVEWKDFRDLLKEVVELL